MKKLILLVFLVIICTNIFAQTKKSENIYNFILLYEPSEIMNNMVNEEKLYEVKIGSLIYRGDILPEGTIILKYLIFREIISIGSNSNIEYGSNEFVFSVGIDNDYNFSRTSIELYIYTTSLSEEELASIEYENIGFAKLFPDRGIEYFLFFWGFRGLGLSSDPVCSVWGEIETLNQTQKDLFDELIDDFIYFRFP
ncbi:MAG: hypothetical protein FWD28_01135 [Treponema sp.]|nr:hypothetical protein [Treponema sp.]